MSAKLMSIVGKLFEGMTRKALARDLDDIAAAVEADEPPGVAGAEASDD